VLFRPEEVHSTSGIRRFLEPLPEGNGHVPNHVPGFCPQDDPIPDLHLDGSSTIQAREIDLNRLSKEKPADRQRFKSSLTKPLLMTIDCNAILGGEVIKRSEGSNQIRIGEKPSGDPGSEKLVEGLSPLLHRDTQFSCDLRVMGCLTGLYHSSHDNMECPIKVDRFIHRLTS